MTRVVVDCECGAELELDVVGSRSSSCSSCGRLWLVGVSAIGRADELEVPDELGLVFLHGRGVEHVDLGTGRTACGLELVDVDVQLRLAGGRRCSWCAIALDSRPIALEVAA